LFSRTRDGNYPVRVFSTARSRRRYEVTKPCGLAVYSSTKEFLAGEKGSTAHWTHDRYFKLGKWNPDPCSSPNPDHLTVLDLFAPSAQDTSLALAPPCPGPVVSFTGHEAITAVEGPRKNPGRAPVSWAGEVLTGIDLENRSKEVAKLFFKAYGSWTRKAQFDDDDVLQEIYKGVLVRNYGKCPWDPSRSTFGNYVTMVARGVVFNHYRRETRRERREFVGYKHVDRGRVIDVDVSETRNLTSADVMWSNDPEIEGEGPLDRLLLYLGDHAHPSEAQLLKDMATMLDLGFKRREIIVKLKLVSGEYTSLNEKLRAHTTAWALSGCL